MIQNLKEAVKEWEAEIWKSTDFELHRNREAMRSKIEDSEFQELVFWLRNRMVESFHFGLLHNARNGKPRALRKRNHA